MPSDPVRVSLDRALSLVDEALAEARAGDWGRVAELDERCRETSQTIAASLVGQDAAPYAEGLRQLRDRHRRLLELAESHRDALARARRDSRRGRQGARVYEENL